MKRFFLAPLSILFLMISCNEKDLPAPYGQFSNAVFVINEGPYPAGSGTITVYDRETGTVTQDIFETVNGRPLGNVVQSMAIYQDEAWIMVNNSNKIEVVNLSDFKSVKTIDSIGSPRYAVFKNEKAYVSSWENKVYIIDVNNFQVLGEIPTGTGPDELVIIGDYLFTINTGGWETDNSITWANITNTAETGEMVLADRPCSLVKDKYDHLWVLCAGKGFNGYPDPENDTRAVLFCLDPETRAVLDEEIFHSSDIHPDNLVISNDGSDLYYTVPSGIYIISVDPELPQGAIVNATLMYYGLGFDPVSGLLFATDPLDFSQSGYTYIFEPANGATVSYFQAGIAPNGFCFTN